MKTARRILLELQLEEIGQRATQAWVDLPGNGETTQAQQAEVLRLRAEYEMAWKELQHTL